MQKTVLRNELPDLVSVPEAAKYLGVGKKIIYQLLEYGELRAIRMNSKILIDPSSIYDFHNKGKMA